MPEHASTGDSRRAHSRPSSSTTVRDNLPLIGAASFAREIVTVTVTDSDGLQGSETVIVFVVESALNVTAAANPAVIARGQSTVLQCVPTGGLGEYTYQWSGPEGFESTDRVTSATPSDVATAAFVYEVVVTDATGTTASASVTVLVGGVSETVYVAVLIDRASEPRTIDRVALVPVRFKVKVRAAANGTIIESGRQVRRGW